MGDDYFQFFGLYSLMFWEIDSFILFSLTCVEFCSITLEAKGSTYDALLNDFSSR